MPNPLRILLCLLAIGCALSRAPAGEAPCNCEQARVQHAWCASCRVGYVAGARIESEILFEALDSHGHDINPQGLECAVCVRAHASDSFCEGHGRGFVEGQAYFSRLAYEIARGETVDRSGLECSACREHSASHGWCDTCRLGMIGNVAVRDREAYERAARELRILFEAREKLAECELCAASMVSDGRCPICKISYGDGTPVPDP